MTYAVAAIFGIGYVGPERGGLDDELRLARDDMRYMVKEAIEAQKLLGRSLYCETLAKFKGRLEQLERLEKEQTA